MVKHLQENANLYKLITEMYEEKIPFNRIIGFQIISLQTDCVCTRFDMRAELIGNYIKETLHGGVISAVLDATGGLNASIHLLDKLQDASMDEIKKGLARIGTIDLRVDYLRPGRGRFFLAAASIMRAGRKVAVTRMELHNDQELLIAVGTGTYIIG